MKIIHVLKRIETIDHDIKDLRKLEKILQKDKSFTNPIYMSIEKQINIMLGERIKLLELEIANPPENLVKEIEGTNKKNIKSEKIKSPAKTKGKKQQKTEKNQDDDDFVIPMLTQDQIDKKMKELPKQENTEKNDEENDENVKLLDIALQKGTLNKSDVEEEKKKVRFFRDNFPGY